MHCTALYAQVAAAEDFQLSGTARNGTAALLTARSVFVKLISISGNVQCLIRMFHYWSRAEQRYPARAAVPDHDKKRRIASLPEQVKGAAVLYCTVLYCTVLYCTVLYCTVLRSDSCCSGDLGEPQQKFRRCYILRKNGNQAKLIGALIFDLGTCNIGCALSKPSIGIY